MSYKELYPYQLATIVYDLTTIFVSHYIDPRSRATDQMIQAARSGKQNIVEGCSERTSEKSELKLLGVARASFQELLEDYEDYLRQHNLKLWPKDDPRVSELRRIAYLSNKTYKSYSSYLMLPETAGNCLLCLLHQTNYLLDQQIKRAESDFIARGGHTEQLFRKRLNSR